MHLMAGALLLLAGPLGAQDDDRAPVEADGTAAADGADGLPPPRPPPELTAGQRSKLDRALSKLRNSNAERRAATEETIIAFGRGAVPFLVDAAHTDHDGKRDGLVHCLVTLADVNDRELVAACFASEFPALRRFAVIEAGELGLPALLDQLPPRLTDDDEIVAVEAALSLVTNGREEGLDRLVDAWNGPWQARIIAALPGVVDQGSHTILVARLVSDPEEERFDPDAAAAQRRSAVRMLHAIGDRASVRALVRSLDDTHNLVQLAAIDALRDRLEDKPPLKAGSIFEQIREVQRLKELAATR